MTEQQLRDEQGMDAAFRARMRQGLSTMAVRERTRERRRNRAIAGGALAAVVVATAAVFGVQALAGADGQRDQAAPPAPTSEAPAPTPTPEPTPTEPPEPTPPPGFEGVAAGEPIVTESRAGDVGDTGAAGGPHASQIEGYIDSYVLCEGSGQVYSGDELWVDCATLQPGTVIADIGSPQYRDWVDSELSRSADFDGTVRAVPNGEVPEGVGVGGSATVYVECLFEPSVTIGGVRFECMEPVDTGAGSTEVAAEMAAWGVPFGPDELVPRIEVDAASNGSLGVARGTIRFVIER